MWTSHSPPFKSPLSMIILTAIRNRDNEVYSLTASDLQGVMKGPTASGLTMREVIEEISIIGHFHLHQGHL
jgi:hypothetical protein